MGYLVVLCSFAILRLFNIRKRVNEIKGEKSERDKHKREQKKKKKVGIKVKQTGP